MGAVTKLRTALVAAALLVPIAGHGQCVPAIRQVSSLGLSPNRVAGPIASNGSVVALAKLDNTNSTRAIYVSMYDELTLSPATSDRLVTESSLGGPLFMLWNGSEFGLFYQRNDYNVMLQRISTSGELIGAPLLLFPGEAWPNQELDVVYDPFRGAYVAVRTVPQGFTTGLWLSVIRADGTLSHNSQLSPFIGVPVSTPRLAITPTGLVGVTWVMTNSSIDALHFIAVSPANVVDISTFGPISLNGRRQLIATNGTQFLVLVRRETSIGEGDIRSIRIGLNGRVTQAETLFLTPRGLDLVGRELVWNPTLHEWALAYVDYGSSAQTGYAETRLLRFTEDGRANSDSYFVPDLSPQFPVQLVSDMHWTGSGYLASGTVQTSPVSTSTIQRHCPLLVTIQPIARNVIIGTTTTFTALVNGGVPGFSYSWDFGDFSEIKLGEVVTHRFQRTGTYTVRLTATDAAGSRNQTSYTVNVVLPKRRPSRSQ
jgi:hypothetical protein